MKSDDPKDPKDPPQTRKRSNAIFEAPKSASQSPAPKRGQHVQKMGPGEDAKHSQMQGPKPMSEVLSEQLTFTKGQQKHVMNEVNRIKQKQKQGFKADDPDLKRGVNLMEQHSTLLGLGGKAAKEGLGQLRNAQDALKGAEDMRNAFKPFFDKPAGDKGEETEAQRKQAGEAMKSMVGAIKKFGPTDHLKINSRTKTDPDTGEEIADSPAADAMRAFTQSLIKNKDMLKGIVPDKAGQKAAKNAIGVKVSEGKDGNKSINFSMQAPQNKNPMQGLSALMNLGKLGSGAMSSEALGGNNKMAKQMQGLGKLFDSAQKMNMFKGLEKRKQPKFELNISAKPKPEQAKVEQAKSTPAPKAKPSAKE